MRFPRPTHKHLLVADLQTSCKKKVSIAAPYVSDSIYSLNHDVNRYGTNKFFADQNNC